MIVGNMSSRPAVGRVVIELTKDNCSIERLVPTWDIACAEPGLPTIRPMQRVQVADSVTAYRVQLRKPSAPAGLSSLSLRELG